MSKRTRRDIRARRTVHRPELRPIGSEWEWQMRAACRGVDSAVFFAPQGERARERHKREAEAKAVCTRCPVRLRCLQHAYEVDEPYGVWGGLSTTERRALTAATA